MQTERYTLDEHYFHAMDAPEKWYWLGFILADGCILIRKRTRGVEHRLQVRLGERDMKHLECLRQALAFSGPLHPCTQICRGRATVTQTLVIYSKTLCKRLLELGVTPRKSFDGHPMPVVPARDLSSFMRGHFDANGSVSQVSPNGYKLGFSGQHRLMRWMRERIRLKTGVEPGLLYRKQGCGELVYGQRWQVLSLADWLYQVPGPHLHRKREILIPVLGGAT